MSKAWLEARLLPAAFLFRFHALDLGLHGAIALPRRLR
jgi:hypothetical protein